MAATPELTRLMEAVLRNAEPGTEPTLADVREALLTGIVWSGEGELLYAQDTTAFVLELDDLIDCYRMNARARDIVEHTRA